jgi:hypothetical protein
VQDQIAFFGNLKQLSHWWPLISRLIWEPSHGQLRAECLDWLAHINSWLISTAGLYQQLAKLAISFKLSHQQH